MIENNGTTPEFQGNPESGIDRFLNQSNTLPAEVSGIPDKDTLIAQNVELTNKVIDLEAKLADMTTAKDSWYKSWSDLTVDIRRAEAEFKDVLEGDIDSEDIIKAYGPALSHLGWSFTREVEIELTVTYRGTIELPVGIEVDNLDASDFSVESYIGHDSYNADLTHWNSDVEER
jgi:hypothetical protein